MWPFNRRKRSDQASVPEEVREYYQAERRERTSIAWLLAFATLIVTLLLAAGLFYGGRWIYRQFADDEPTATTETVESPESSDQADENDADQSPANGQTDTPPAQLPSGENGTDSQSGGSSPSPTPQTQPVTGDTLPNTGPSGND